MIKVLIKANARYPVNRKKIRALVKDVLGKHGLEKDIEVSILIAGDRKMKALNSQYRKINKPTNVLSFPLKENKFPDKTLRLGDIAISFPQARKQAAEENILLDEEINRLIKHGLLSLLGLEE